MMNVEVAPAHASTIGMTLSVVWRTLALAVNVPATEVAV